ncbi:integrase [Sulfuriferula nivalis]|uniref:Integrase n=1 Tax=Sulfuriferula nivalis TaxID=2675298 RepID=A0A809S210_9PROT|nr:tyrosine-type recombinase/integrase [Sulfuriferula nivalis]BBP00658.1 integrase [Sulfuriferula nivalis]
MTAPTPIPAHFEHNHQRLLNCLKLRGMQPKTIALYSHGVRRAAVYFNDQIDALTKPQLTDYFVRILDTHSWSTLKHDLYGLKFYYAHVLSQPWPSADLVKPPKSYSLPDIITVAQAQQIFMATRVLSYRVFFFTLYSLGLRLGEGLRLQVGDIDADRMRVQVRNAKGNRDRLVPLSENTLQVLRRFWLTHRNPSLLFPNRHGGLAKSHLARTPLDRGGIQTTLGQVTRDCGLKKELHHTACATAMPPT